MKFVLGLILLFLYPLQVWKAEKPDFLFPFQGETWVTIHDQTIKRIDDSGKVLAEYQNLNWMGYANAQIQTNIRLWVSHPLNGFMELDNRLIPLREFSWEEFGLAFPSGMHVDGQGNIWTIDLANRFLVMLDLDQGRMTYRYPLIQGNNEGSDILMEPCSGNLNIIHLTVDGKSIYFNLKSRSQEDIPPKCTQSKRIEAVQDGLGFWENGKLIRVVEVEGLNPKDPIAYHLTKVLVWVDGELKIIPLKTENK